MMWCGQWLSERSACMHIWLCSVACFVCVVFSRMIGRDSWQQQLWVVVPSMW
jgi:hypothetical protein